MADRDIVLQQALRACFFGDDGELTPSGRLVLNWLRDVICEWGDDPLSAEVYDGDLMKVGERIGRSNVYGRLMQEIYLQPELERIVAMQEAIVREKAKHDKLANGEDEAGDFITH